MPLRLRAGYVFAAFWLALLLLYLPAAHAGWVSDTLGWLEAVRSQHFWDFISRKGFSVPSYYQLTQTVTWCLYQLFGVHAWAWHLTQLSLHALNATLLFVLLRGLFQDAGLASASWMAGLSAALFCLSPSVSEVIVWEASFHFLQGMLLLLVQMLLLRKMLHGAGSSWALLACFLFALSLFSLEYFYLVPLLLAAVCLFYRKALKWEKSSLRRSFLGIVLPQGILLLLYFSFLRLVAHTSTGRLGNDWQNMRLASFLVKPPEYLFHLFGGRFLPLAWRMKVYEACASYPGAALFYGAIAAFVFFLVFRYKNLGRRQQIMCLMLVWLLAGMALESPLWFPQRLLIVGDRYLYLLLPPFLALLVLLLQPLKSLRLQWALGGALLIPEALLCFSLNTLWQQSEQMTQSLQQKLSDAPGKMTILLNNPASLRGALMIGAGSDGEARLMHNLFFKPKIQGQMYDAAAQNLLRPDDRIRIEVTGKNCIRVSLMSEGAFWQYGTDLAHSYSNEAYSLIVEDPYCCYVLCLKQPVSQYRLLYQQGLSWREFKLPERE
ncbi:MAG: hypothetical protein JST06_09905 [Bacteroidetes bacterium]|nr:hypothetical protein [Bacteroidota bacterium]